MAEFASPQQEAFVLAGPHPTLMLGGYGSAKTYGASLKLHRLIEKYPESRWAIIRRVHKHLKATTQVTFDAMTPQWAIKSRNDQEGTREFLNGSRVQFLGLDTEGVYRVWMQIMADGTAVTATGGRARASGTAFGEVELSLASDPTGAPTGNCGFGTAGHRW